MLLLYFIIFAVRLPPLQKMYLQDPFAKQPRSNTIPGRQPPESLFLILHENVAADKIRPAKMQKKWKDPILRLRKGRSLPLLTKRQRRRLFTTI